MFRIPAYYPTWNVGTQIFNPGNSRGEGSHPREQMTQPRIYPLVYAVGTYGLGAMPRQVMGITAPIVVNTFNNARSISNLAIGGLFKS